MGIDAYGSPRPSHSAEREAPQPLDRDDVRMVSSADIFQAGEHEIAIFHGDSVYSLKITKLGKLVLNK